MIVADFRSNKIAPKQDEHHPAKDKEIDYDAQNTNDLLPEIYTGKFGTKPFGKASEVN